MRCEDKWSHNFIAGTCIDCGTSQQEISDKGLKRIEIKKPKPKKITSEFQLLVDDTMNYFNEDTHKKGNFAKWAKLIKFIGKEELLKFLSYCKKKKIKSPKYFMGFYKSKYNKLIWKKYH